MRPLVGSVGLALLLAACAESPLPTDATAPDLSFADAFTVDARAPDAAPLDLGSLDADAPDTGEPDAGALDAAALDAAALDARTPEEVDILSIAVRTGTPSWAGTDANEISVCLTETRCFRLNVADVDDFRVGELDVYHFEGVGLSRRAIDRVEIRSANGTDRWAPSCLQVELDGEPIHCRRLTAWFGNAAREVESLRDTVVRDCGSCYPSPITHGPFVGAVEPDAVRIWARTDHARTARVRVADNARFDRAIVRELSTAARDDYAGSVRIDGLAPRSTYFYEVEVAGERTRPATFGTAPAPMARGRTSIAFGSCTRTAEQPLFAIVGSYEPDLFLFVGDNHYANSGDLDSLRWFYRWSLERRERAALLRRTPTLAVWDDHDFTGNNTDGTAPGKATALRAFREYWANPSHGTADQPGVFFRHAYGGLELFMLDDRYERGLDGTLLGARQTRWLEDAVRTSSATFKLLVSGSQWTPEGSADSWAAFPAAREALFARLAPIPGVVLLSGDIHRAEHRVIPRRGAYALPELTSSPMANTNSACRADPAQRSCFDDGVFFGLIEVDTTLADPLLASSIIDGRGVLRDRWEIRASQLR